MTLKFKSILRRADTMESRRVDGIIKNAIDVAMQAAIDTIGPGEYVARQAHRGDFPPTATTQRLWNETTGTTTDQFITAAIGNGTAINDDTVLVLYGCRWLFAEIPSFAPLNRQGFRPPVSSLRIVVGGTRVAEWDLYTIFTPWAGAGANTSLGTTRSHAQNPQPIGIAESPIVIKPRTTLLLQYYELSTSAVDFGIQVLGIVVEKLGAGDGLNP